MVRCPQLRSGFGWGVAVLLLTIIGCQTLGELGIPGLSHYVDTTGAAKKAEEKRNTWQESRDPAAMRWLLTNQLDNGMSVDDVNLALGEHGVREYQDTRFKTGGSGRFRTTDKAYKWGPDSEGTSIVLFFRNGALVNFDPAEFDDSF